MNDKKESAENESRPSAEQLQLSLPHMESVKQAVADLSTPPVLQFFENSSKFPKKQVSEELEPALRDYLHLSNREGVSEEERQKRLEDFEAAILELMKDSADALFGRGEQGMVYRFVFGNREFVVVKRRIDSNEDNQYTKLEYEVHKHAKLATQAFQHVQTPEVYAHIKDRESKNEYIVMEHVYGKSIETLLLEQVLNYEYLPILE
jgi:hypothetical protein